MVTFKFSLSKVYLIIACGLFAFCIKWVYDMKEPMDRVTAASLAVAAFSLVKGIDGEKIGDLKSQRDKQEAASKKSTYDLTWMILIQLYKEHFISTVTDPKIQALISPQIKEKSSSLAQKFEEYEKRCDIRQEIAQHLTKAETQEQLKHLTKEACDYALAITDQRHLKRIGLANPNSKVRFYNEVYLYLRVWLKNSIEYDIEMPLISHSIPEIDPYTDAIKFLRDNRSAYFITDETFQSKYQELEDIVQQYLDALVAKLENFG